MFSKPIGSGRWIQTRTGPLSLDPHQAVRLTDRTLAIYLKAGRPFTEWLRKHRLEIHIPEEAGDLLVEYKNAPDGLAASGAPTHTAFTHTIAFVGHVFPSWRGSLGWSHTVASAWVKSSPIKHTVPCPRHFALVIAFDM